MKMILIVTLLIYLRTFATGEINCNLSNYQLMYTAEQSACEVDAELVITCINKTVEKESSINAKSVCCKIQGNSTPATEVPTMTTQTKATLTEMTTHPICKCQAAGSVASIGLGAVVALLVALLAVVTTGWMWTCWTMKRRARIITNLKNISNPSYGGNQLTLQNYPLPTPTPTYETIPPLSNFMDDIKLDLAEPKEEGCDAGNNREEAYHKLNRAQRDNKKGENKDQIYNTGQREEYQGKEIPSGGSDLQEIQHSNANTSTECLLDSAVPSEEGQSASPADVSKISQECCETVNSSVKNEDKKLDGITLEHNHDQIEASEKEQALTKKKATPRDYEIAIPSIGK